MKMFFGILLSLSLAAPAFAAPTDAGAAVDARFNEDRKNAATLYQELGALDSKLYDAYALQIVNTISAVAFVVPTVVMANLSIKPIKNYRLAVSLRARDQATGLSVSTDAKYLKTQRSSALILGSATTAFGATTAGLTYNVVYFQQSQIAPLRAEIAKKRAELAAALDLAESLN